MQEINRKQKILAILGSLRINSSNEMLLKKIESIYKDQISLDFFPIGTLPHFDPNLSPEEIPEIVKEFIHRIRESDGVIISTPEYVFSPPAVLKNCLEWTVSETVFTDKPTALIVASGNGERTLESISLVLKTLQVSMPEASKLLLKGLRSQRKDDDFTNLEIVSRLDSLMKSFLLSLKLEKI
jgi:chromate reductase, NAD(P)H dehydrogenase (quinone)